MSNESTYRRQDASLSATKALHNGAGADICDAFEVNPSGALLAGCELEISAPVLAAGALPNAETVKYSIVSGSTTSPTTVIAADVLTQTGAGGVGAAAATKRFRLPTDVARYAAVKATVSAGGGDCSASSFGAKLLT